MLRYSLLTAGLLLGASAFAAPAGDLPPDALACEG
ncbi:glycoside hydrolase family protein [Enterobacter cloacae]|uniref:Glycoside hydrolase family protein n=1 Tax=Enterobacter cloacae TaxID=550 RepID=A0A377M7C1_ENTCL|nr:glycoside hydrolase family protein [Enterobacter cloacae]